MNGYKSDDSQKELYEAARDGSFDKLILSLLEKGKLHRSLREKIFDRDTFAMAFTHPSASETNNYEYHEFLGDLLVNKSIGQYLTERFPQLRCREGVRVLTRLKINLVSKKVLSGFAEECGFWRFIAATMEYRNTKKKPMLEDCFEAVLGLIEELVDEKCRKPDSGGRVVRGGGYMIGYNIVKSILDKHPICGGYPNPKTGMQSGRLIYCDLVDPKTRLKELFDCHRAIIGKVKYFSQREPMNDGSENTLSHTFVYSEPPVENRSPIRPPWGNSRKERMNNKTYHKLGFGIAALQADSQQAAAAQALIFLTSRNISKQMPAYYAKFCD